MNVFGPAIDATKASIVGTNNTKLGRQNYSIAPVRDRPPEQLLIGMRAVHVCGIEEVDAQIERSM